MKKFLLKFVLFLGYAVMNNGIDRSSASYNGSTHLQNQSFSMLTVNGSSHLLNIDALDTIVRGALNANKCKFKTLQVFGGVSLEESIILEELHVNGGCHVNQSEFKHVTINGGFHVECSKVKGKTIINGGIHGIHTEFKDIIICASEIVLDCCKIFGSLTIKEVEQSWYCFAIFPVFCKKQELKLTDTIVDGDVVFEKKDGLIYLNGKSKIKGKIVNGKVVTSK